jgi:hypothetical protein
VWVDPRFPDGLDEREKGKEGGREGGREREGEREAYTHWPTCTRLRITAAQPRGRSRRAKGNTRLARHAAAFKFRTFSPVAFPSETVAKMHL